MSYTVKLWNGSPRLIRRCGTRKLEMAGFPERASGFFVTHHSRNGLRHPLPKIITELSAGLGILDKERHTHCKLFNYL